MYVKHFLQIYMAYFSPLLFLNKRNKATFRLQLKVAEIRLDSRQQRTFDRF